ncbi:hypothetical protein [Pseudoduganella sp. OTU4001]|uniref:hypothetical protein n=1 Tax=Pseudoduganella sp. OTU4001 TaxID=3043854 RepID=UPI00313DD937
MNGNESAQHPDLFNHEVRITRLEEAVKYMRQTIEHGFARMEQGFEAQRKQIDALQERMDRNDAALRQEFHRDRRFSAMVFLATQIAVIGALLELAGIL